MPHYMWNKSLMVPPHFPRIQQILQILTSLKLEIWHSVGFISHMKHINKDAGIRGCFEGHCIVLVFYEKTPPSPLQYNVGITFPKLHHKTITSFKGN